MGHALPKNTRIVDKALLREIKLLPCTVCNRYPPSDPHHVTSKGSGGHDTRNNVMPLCRRHHRLVEDIGIREMIVIHPRFELWLIEHERSDIFSKLSIYN